MEKAEQVVEAYMKEFPNCGDVTSADPEVAEVEKVLRPFAPITFETHCKISELFAERDVLSAPRVIDCWWQANFAVSGSGNMHNTIVESLIDDLCMCVIPHLEAALEHVEDVSAVHSKIVQVRDIWLEGKRDHEEFYRLWRQRNI